MSFRKISRKDLLAGCADPGAGDGRDPRYDLREGPEKVPNRKARQVCGQAERTLNMVLAGCGDDVLRSLLVASVAPAPTSARLLVTVHVATPVEGVDADGVLARLEGARGMLRSEVAAALHRRQAPDLMFRVADAPSRRG
jgi:ribosome-binding factor A